ncbi:pilin [Fusibacter sp. JL216-2]|uniref:pilin n=1 Tax=Fusibacter sp. JL216-2 TaxID=3071453 RepID=UPI003D32969C
MRQNEKFIKLFGKRRGNNGFTLIELMFVFALLGLLFAVALPSMIDYIDLTNDRVNQTNAEILQKEVSVKTALGEIQVNSTSFIDVTSDVQALSINFPQARGTRNEFEVFIHKDPNDDNQAIIEVRLGTQVLSQGSVEILR